MSRSNYVALRQDETEARVVHRMLCELVEQRDPAVLGGDLCQVGGQSVLKSCAYIMLLQCRVFRKAGGGCTAPRAGHKCKMNAAKHMVVCTPSISRCVLESCQPRCAAWKLFA